MPSESAIRRLAFIRYLLRLGVEQSYAPEPLCSAAVLSFHDSVELLLHLAAEELNVAAGDLRFMDYFDRLNAKLAPQSLGQIETMRRLNKSRVNLKHHGTMPSRLDIESFRASVISFFGDSTPIVFGIDFGSVSLAHLVEAAATREALLDADRCIADNRFEEASGCLAKALAYEMRERQISAHVRLPRMPHLNGAEAKALSRVLDPLLQAVGELTEEMTLIRNGVDTKRLAVFRQFTPIAHVMMSGGIQLAWTGRMHEPTAERARFCYDFVIDTVLALQQQAAALSDVLASRRS